MARARAKFNAVTMGKWIREGRGQGHGKHYKPWLRVQNVPSNGYANRILGWKTNRRHEFMSNLEASYFYLLEWSPSITDVREQYPLLPLSETIEIAEQCGVKHPTVPGTMDRNVLTTDFLVDVTCNGQTIERARTIKPSQTLSSDRILEKFEIERRYWLRREVDWAVVTERDIPRTLVKNLEWIHRYRYISETFAVTPTEVDKAEQVLSGLLQEGTPLTTSTNECDDRLGFAAGTSLGIVRHLLATRRWMIDMSKPVDFRQPIILLNKNTVMSEWHGSLCKHAA